MKKILSVLAVLLLLTLLSPLVYASDYKDYDYYIKDFRVEVTANPNRNYDVVETITVDFNVDSRGIYRDIETESSVERYTIGNIRVSGDPYTIEEYTDYVRVRIGDPDVYLTGEKTYVISYTRVHYDDGEPDYDYFYMDMIGDKWDCPIAHFSAAVKLPKEAEIHTYTLTSGPTGSTGNDYAKGKTTDNVIEVSMKKPLEPYMAVTLNVEMLQGAFGDAVVYVPSIEIHHAEVNAELDEYGVVRVEEHYDATIHEDNPFRHPVFPDSNYWIDPDGNHIDYDIEYAGFLNSYVGQRIQFSYVYEVGYEITGLESEYCLFLFLLANNNGVAVHEYTVNLVSPFELSRCSLRDTFKDRAPDTYTMSLSDGGKQLHMEAAAKPNAKYTSVGFYVSNLKRRTTEADLIIPCIAVLVAVFLCALAFFGKIGKKLVTPIEFYPPDNMNPAEVGYIIDGKVTARDITSLIYYWASCGNLSIEMTDEKNFILHKIADLDSTHKPYEIEMFNKLFDYGINGMVKNSQLEEKFYRNIWDAGEHVKKYFTKEQRLERFRALPMLMNLAVMAATMLMFAVFWRLWTYSEDVITFWLAAVAMCPTLYSTISGYKQNKHLRKSSKVALMIFSILFYAAFAASFIGTTIGQALGVVPTFVTLAAFTVVFISVPNLSRKTDLGYRLLERCIGFRMFLETAEKTRLEMLLEENPEYYYNILPYAQVMEISDVWEKKFDGLLTQLPSWYRSDGAGSVMRASDFSSVTDSISKSVNLRPAGKRNSGGDFSDGGGYSGGGYSGGGGGGGGGRW